MTVDVTKLLPWILGIGEPVSWEAWEAVESLFVGLPVGKADLKVKYKQNKMCKMEF